MATPTRLWDHDFQNLYAAEPEAYVSAVHFFFYWLYLILDQKNEHNLDALDHVLKCIEEQGERDGRLCNGQPTGEVPPGYPIKEYTIGKWMRMPVSQRQFIHKSSLIILRHSNSEELAYNTHDPSDVELLLGNLDQVRILHGMVDFFTHGKFWLLISDCRCLPRAKPRAGPLYLKRPQQFRTIHRIVCR